LLRCINRSNYAILQPSDWTQRLVVLREAGERAQRARSKAKEEAGQRLKKDKRTIVEQIVEQTAQEAEQGEYLQTMAYFPREGEEKEDEETKKAMEDEEDESTKQAVAEKPEIINKTVANAKEEGARQVPAKEEAAATENEARLPCIILATISVIVDFLRRGIQIGNSKLF